jgi:hypothetical protein
MPLSPTISAEKPQYALHTSQRSSEVQNGCNKGSPKLSHNRAPRSDGSMRQLTLIQRNHTCWLNCRLTLTSCMHANCLTVARAGNLLALCIYREVGNAALPAVGLLPSSEPAADISRAETTSTQLLLQQLHAILWRIGCTSSTSQLNEQPTAYLLPASIGSCQYASTVLPPLPR